jgi:hypothetical protein
VVSGGVVAACTVVGLRVPAVPAPAS